MRTHIVLPDEIVTEIDGVVGVGARSRFIAEATEEKLRKIRRAKLGRKMAGSLANVDIPGWETSESAVEWVNKLRQGADERLKAQWEDRG